MGSLVRTVRAGIAWLSLCAAFSTPLFASGTDYEGTWNAGNAAHGIVKLVIAGSTDGSGAMSVHAFGTCPPAPCDFGTVPLTGLNSVASHPGAPTSEVGNATFTTSSGVTKIKISGYKTVGLNDFITVETIGTAGDKYGRISLPVTESFEKATLRLPHPIVMPSPSAPPTGIILRTPSPK